MGCDVEIRLYIKWVLYDVLRYIFFYIFYFFVCHYSIEIEKEKMKEVMKKLDGTMALAHRVRAKN